MPRLVEVHPHRPGRFEFVERKGLGHPDTICDAIAEELSIALSRAYLERFGQVLHHNVDKVLLRGGASLARFGGGEILEPIELYLGGRATRSAAGVQIPVTQIAIETTRTWLRDHLAGVDVERHVRIHDLIRPGSTDLVGLFEVGRGANAPRSNDTSIGVGFAPATGLESVVLAVDAAIRAASAEHPSFGADLKIMALRDGPEVTLTLACAQVDRHLRDLDEYRDALVALRRIAFDAAHTQAQDVGTIAVNQADDLLHGRCYLTVSGTSAEAGDDGEVGRGNRVGGLITPHRPMTMEAAAGKNAITHVGKLYNVLAHSIAADLCASIDGVRAAQVFLLSQIGRPIDDPAATHVQLELAAGVELPAVRPAVDAALDRGLASTPGLWRGVLERAFPIY